MSILDKAKRLIPKTPKQWVVTGLGVAAVGLTADYVWRKDDSIVAGLLHKLHGGGGHPALPHGHGHRRHPAHPAMPGAAPMYVPPIAQPPMVFVEPSLANPFFYEFRNYGMQYPHHHHHHHAHHQPYAFEHHEHGQHAPPHGLSHHDVHPMYGQHVAGAPPSEKAPGAPKQARAKIPAPGAYGIVSTTPQADGIVAGQVSVGYGWEEA